MNNKYLEKQGTKKIENLALNVSILVSPIFKANNT